MRSFKFLFMRHGQTIANVENLCSGGDNPHELTEDGKKQTNISSTNFSKLGIVPDKIYFSPAIRTTQTKNIFVANNKFENIPQQIIAEFRERLFGEFENKDFNLVKGKVWSKDFYPKDGEQVEVFLNRIKSAINILSLCDGLPMVVAHGMAFEAMFRIYNVDAPWIYNSDIYEICVSDDEIISRKLCGYDN